MVRLFITLFLSTALGFAQKGDRKEHHSMADVVPPELIPPAPVLSVEQALKAFTIHPDFIIEPVAAEPLVEKPVALTFDDRGRIWVVEMRGYMADIDGKTEDQPTGRIAILEDTNGDGQADKRTTFLDNLVLPRALLLVPGGLIFADQKYLYFSKRNGDQPDGTPVILDNQFSTFGNVEHKPNGLLLNIDNWIYNAKSSIRYKYKDGKIIKEKTRQRGQWGITKDNLGRLYWNHNSTLLRGEHILPNLLYGNPAIRVKRSMSNVIGPNNVYPGRVTPGINRAYISTLNNYKTDTLDPQTHKLINTSAACGPVIYRGTQFPKEYHNQAFVCESAAQLVKLINLTEKRGIHFGTHPLGKKEFLTSTDERFRPVNLFNAPDGSLYLLDFYHGIIQHKTYMTSYLRNQTISRGLHQPGMGHGRIYRIRHKTRPLNKEVDLSKATESELLQHLGNPSGYHRDLAQQILIQRKISPAPLIKILKNTNSSPLHQMHAIWTLEGLGKLKPEHLRNQLLRPYPDDLVITALYASLSISPEVLAQHQNLYFQTFTVTKKTRSYLAKVLATIPTAESQQELSKLLKKNLSGTPYLDDAAIAGLTHNANLFTKNNVAGYSGRFFNEKLQKTISGPATRKKDPAALLSGAHLQSYQRGKKLYNGTAACVGCHGTDGSGLPNLGPQLDQSDWVTGDETRLIKILLHGLTGPIKINGKTFTPNAVMPGLAQNTAIDDQAIADVTTFIRATWSNRAPQVTQKTVSKIRNKTKSRQHGQMYTQQDFD